MDRQGTERAARSTSTEPPSRNAKRGRAADLQSGVGPSGDAGEWRNQVASRVENYRVRRRRGFDPDLSLRLDFEAQRQANRSMLTSAIAFDPHADSAELHSAIKNEGPQPEVCIAPSANDVTNHDAPEIQSPECAAQSEPAAPPPRPIRMRKIIEFPRPAALFDQPVNELAEPVLDTPRILEAPEIAPADLLPAVPAITLDSTADDLAPLDLEVPIQPASLQRRGAAAFLDCLALATACALFAYVAARIAPIQPAYLKLRAGALAAAASLGVLWAVYHYLFLVFGAFTPGMRAAGLEIRTFDERLATRGVRCRRFVSVLLSCLAAGLGFAWVLLDEDSLGWHDRMSHTYLANANASAHE